jgi:hypothetical protein
VTLGVSSALLVGTVIAAVPAFADSALGTQEHRGASMLNVVAVVPNPDRCGPFPPNVELQFTGEGTDTGGGPFTSVASACQDTATGAVFDLQSVDTYAAGGSITILSEPFILAPGGAPCLATNDKPVKYTLPGGTGAFAQATGEGTYNIYVTLPGCGVGLPALVAFEGKIKL